MLVGGPAGLIGCASDPVTSAPAFCDVSSALRFSAKAVKAMDREDKEQIRDHNKYGEANCDWKP